MVRLTNIFVLRGICLAYLLTFHWSGVAQSQKINSNLPIIQNVGVIPVQWDNPDEASFAFPEAKSLADSEFSNAIRASRKFRVVNDALVASQWKDAETRRELVESQELNAFFSLQVQLKSDVVVFIARLLSPSMETYLLESSSTNRFEFKTASRGKVIGMIENLIFKMLNRIPVDAHVTSLQGRFVTISGGQLRGVEIGDRIEIVRPFIISRHPANGSWMKINTKKLGHATVVEVKTYTSVAKLEDMIAEDAIRVGDGMLVPKIKSRAKFRGERLGQARNPGRVNSPVVVNPMYPGDTKVKPVLPKKGDPQPAQQVNPTQQSGNQNVAEGGAEDPVVSDDGFVSPGTDDLKDIVDMLVDYGRGAAGMRLWSYGGSAKASAAFPLILVNHGRITFGKRMMKDIIIEASGNVNFGTTEKGSFFGFGGGARAFMTRPMKGYKNWRAGAEGQFNSMAVTSETFGGGDVVTGGGFVGVDGPFRLEESQIRYYAEFALFPINLGQMGAGGTKRSIQSSFQWRLTLAGTFELTPEEQRAKEWAWGGQMEIDNYTYSLDGGKSLSGSSVNFLVTTAWNF